MHKDLRKTFARDESGAVTVDWVVLTAAVVALAVGVAVLLGGEEGGIISTLQTTISNAISSVTGGGPGG